MFRAGSRMLLRLLVIGSIGVVSKEVESTELSKVAQIVECFPFSLFFKSFFLIPLQNLLELASLSSSI